MHAQKVPVVSCSQGDDLKRVWCFSVFGLSWLHCVQFIVFYPSVVLVCLVGCVQNWGAVIFMVLFAKVSSETWSQVHTGEYSCYISSMHYFANYGLGTTVVALAKCATSLG